MHFAEFELADNGIIDVGDLPDGFDTQYDTEVFAVDGNGEVISANPYISTDTEKYTANDPGVSFWTQEWESIDGLEGLQTGVVHETYGNFDTIA